MNIKKFGGGCTSCKKLYENTKKAVSETGLDIEVEYITDMEIVMTYGIMSMPAWVIDDNVVSKGKVLKPVDITKFIEKEID